MSRKQDAFGLKYPQSKNFVYCTSISSEIYLEAEVALLDMQVLYDEQTFGSPEK